MKVGPMAGGPMVGPMAGVLIWRGNLDTQIDTRHL